MLNLLPMPLWRNSRPGYCLKCSGWLGSRSSLSFLEPSCVETTNEFQWNVWVANTLGNLIASAHQQHSPLPRETIKKAKAVFVNKCSDGDVLAFGQLMGVSKSKITQWYSGATIPMLDKLLKICDRLKISLVEFFQEGILPLSTTISNQAAFSPSSLPKQPTLTSLLNKRRVRNLLGGVLHQNEYPSPSVREVSLDAFNLHIQLFPREVLNSLQFRLPTSDFRIANAHFICALAYQVKISVKIVVKLD